MSTAFFEFMDVKTDMDIIKSFDTALRQRLYNHSFKLMTSEVDRDKLAEQLIDFAIRYKSFRERYQKACDNSYLPENQENS